MKENPGDASGDIWVALIVVGVIVVGVIVVGGIFPSAWTLLQCLYGHLAGTVGGSCL